MYANIVDTRYFELPGTEKNPELNVILKKKGNIYVINKKNVY